MKVWILINPTNPETHERMNNPFKSILFWPPYPLTPKIQLKHRVGIYTAPPSAPDDSSEIFNIWKFSTNIFLARKIKPNDRNPLHISSRISWLLRGKPNLSPVWECPYPKPNLSPVWECPYSKLIKSVASTSKVKLKAAHMWTPVITIWKK